MKKFIILTVFVFTAATVSANVQYDNANQNSTFMKADHAYAQDQAFTDADKVINKNIRDKLSGWFTDDFRDIALSTNNGVVTVTGFADSNDDVSAITDKVSKVDGVKEVKNNVTVKAVVK